MTRYPGRRPTRHRATRPHKGRPVLRSVLVALLITATAAALAALVLGLLFPAPRAYPADVRPVTTTGGTR